MAGGLFFVAPIFAKYQKTIESAKQAEFVVTSKGGVELHYESFVYRFREARKSGAVSWNCDRARKEFKRPGNASADAKGGAPRCCLPHGAPTCPTPATRTSSPSKYCHPNRVPGYRNAGGPGGRVVCATAKKDPGGHGAPGARRLSRKRKLDAEYGVAGPHPHL